MRRWVRRTGGTLLRRLGAVPEGLPDGLGEDAALSGGSFRERVLVQFPETLTNLYQLRQWYAPLEALAERVPVRIVVQDSRVGSAVRTQTTLPVSVVARSATLDDVLSRSDVAAFLYVSHHPGNFQALRVGDVAHVYLTHGDSDKAVSVSNQLKAYDVTLVPGRAAIERAAQRLLWFDAPARMRAVGRPQLDPLRDAPAPTAPGAPRRVVLYAPTWEGAQPSTGYSSLADRGRALVAALLREPGLAVVYRPHPRTGARLEQYADADREVRALVAEAAAADPRAGHRVDTGPDAVASMRAADVLVCDVSAMALDWLVTGRPLVLTEPPASADVAATALLDVVPILGRDADLAGRLVRRVLEDDGAADGREDLADLYLSTSLGLATPQFVGAVVDLVTERDALVARG